MVVRGVGLREPGVHRVDVKTPDDGKGLAWSLCTKPGKAVARNVVLLLANGLSVGRRTVARILSKGVVKGMCNAPPAMVDMPYMALLGAGSVDTIEAESANTALACMAGRKASVNAHRVYADRTKAGPEDPRQETIAELVRHKTGKAVGVASDVEIEDAAPASGVAHTR